MSTTWVCISAYHYDIATAVSLDKSFAGRLVVNATLTVMWEPDAGAMPSTLSSDVLEKLALWKSPFQLSLWHVDSWKPMLTLNTVSPTDIGAKVLEGWQRVIEQQTQDRWNLACRLLSERKLDQDDQWKYLARDLGRIQVDPAPNPEPPEWFGPVVPWTMYYGLGGFAVDVPAIANRLHLAVVAEAQLTAEQLKEFKGQKASAFVVLPHFDNKGALRGEPDEAVKPTAKDPEGPVQVKYSNAVPADLRACAARLADQVLSSEASMLVQPEQTPPAMWLRRTVRAVSADETRLVPIVHGVMDVLRQIQALLTNGPDTAGTGASGLVLAADALKHFHEAIKSGLNPGWIEPQTDDDPQSIPAVWEAVIESAGLSDEEAAKVTREMADLWSTLRTKSLNDVIDATAWHDRIMKKWYAADQASLPPDRRDAPNANDDVRIRRTLKLLIVDEGDRATLVPRAELLRLTLQELFPAANYPLAAKLLADVSAKELVRQLSSRSFAYQQATLHARAAVRETLTLKSKTGSGTDRHEAVRTLLLNKVRDIVKPIFSETPKVESALLQVIDSALSPLGWRGHNFGGAGALSYDEGPSTALATPEPLEIPLLQALNQNELKNYAALTGFGVLLREKGNGPWYLLQTAEVRAITASAAEQPSERWNKAVFAPSPLNVGPGFAVSTLTYEGNGSAPPDESEGSQIAWPAPQSRFELRPMRGAAPPLEYGKDYDTIVFGVDLSGALPVQVREVLNDPWTPAGAIPDTLLSKGEAAGDSIRDGCSVGLAFRRRVPVGACQLEDPEPKTSKKTPNFPSEPDGVRPLARQLATCFALKRDERLPIGLDITVARGTVYATLSKLTVEFPRVRLAKGAKLSIELVGTPVGAGITAAAVRHLTITLIANQDVDARCTIMPAKDPAEYFAIRGESIETGRDVGSGWQCEIKADGLDNASHEEYAWHMVLSAQSDEVHASLPRWYVDGVASAPQKPDLLFLAADSGRSGVGQSNSSSWKRQLMLPQVDRQTAIWSKAKLNSRMKDERVECVDDPAVEGIRVTVTSCFALKNAPKGDAIIPTLGGDAESQVWKFDSAASGSGKKLTLECVRVENASSSKPSVHVNGDQIRIECPSAGVYRVRIEAMIGKRELFHSGLWSRWGGIDGEREWRLGPALDFMVECEPSIIQHKRAFPDQEVVKDRAYLQWQGGYVLGGVREAATAVHTPSLLAWAFVGQIEVELDTWRWQGQPVHVPGDSLHKCGQDDERWTSIACTMTEAQTTEFEARTMSKKPRTRLFRSETIFGATATEPVREDVSTRSQGIYFRANYCAISRYARKVTSTGDREIALLPPHHRSVTDPNAIAWTHRCYVPYRGTRRLDPPRVKMILPLLDRVNVLGPGDGTSLQPAVLVVLDEPWFHVGGPDEMLAAEVAVTHRNLKHDGTSRKPFAVFEIGRDPVLSNAKTAVMQPAADAGIDVKVKQLAPKLQVFGPIGHTFDTGTGIEELIYSSSVVLTIDPASVPLEKNENPENEPWTEALMAKVRFRRSVLDADRRLVDSEPSRAFWLQFPARLTRVEAFEASRCSWRKSNSQSEIVVRDAGQMITAASKNNYSVWAILTQIVRGISDRAEERFVSMNILLLKPELDPLNAVATLTGIAVPDQHTAFRLRLMVVQHTPGSMKSLVTVDVESAMKSLWHALALEDETFQVNRECTARIVSVSAPQVLHVLK